MTDVDYEAIQAAVTETVRGRWFLNEFARRNRGAEVTLLLDAMARLETQVATSLAVAPSRQPALPAPSADPSIRLLIQRIKEIAGQLDTVAQALRDGDVDDDLCASVELQARAVAGLMRTGLSVGPAVKPAIETPPTAETEPLPIRRVATSSQSAPEPSRVSAPTEKGSTARDDPRLQALAALDRLPLAKKLAFFT